MISWTHDFLFPTEIVEKIRQLYGTREQRLLPVPWCEDFSFHLNEIFTRLKIMSKEKIRGVLTDDITNMTAIFKAHVECQRPRTVLIEGDPGMGKSTYCQKLAYDWATRQKELDPSFPDIELLLLLKCHEVKSSIWKAIDDQLLPAEIDDHAKECFFKFVRENQSKALLVLDGLDEMDSTEMKRIYDLVEGKELSGCHVILTSRHEVGRKLRRYCDTLWEIVGFTEEDANSFIRAYFKSINREDLLEKLLEKIRYSYELSNLSKNPLNVTLLCVLCEDLEGIFPTSRTELYTEIVLCVLRRYEKKQGLSSKSEDLMSIYRDNLVHLGRVALHSLRKGVLYFEEHESGSPSFALSKFGFLSLQASGCKRKALVRYAFLHKSFQEFFSGFYLACQILDGSFDCVSVVKDERMKNELKEAFLFMIGILASTSKETAEYVIKIMAENINLIDLDCKEDICVLFQLALGCILECTSLSRTLGLHLHISNLDLTGVRIDASGVAVLSKVLSANSSLTSLNLGSNFFGGSGATSLSKALTTNSSLTSLDLRSNRIGDSGAASLSQALTTNSSLTSLNLSGNSFGVSGAASLSQALTTNSSLTSLDLGKIHIGNSGATSLSQALATNSSLTSLILCENNIDASGATSLSQALATNSSLTSLDLSENSIDASGATSLSQALATNSSLTSLNLRWNSIGASGATSLSQALATNSSLTSLNLSWNNIRASGATSLSQALATNSSLTSLNLRSNFIGDSGATSLSQALATNSSLTSLNLRSNGIGDSGAASLCQALATNSSLTSLNLRKNFIRDSGAASFSQALATNSSLTSLDLRENIIGDCGAASLSQALAVNPSLTRLDLS
ncbi:unnamed protein product [Porites evermanni]|uniref:NACHT domain-containing protein n=1 Tax=Porites evermanni TaxID=104178 RepID=A0ABN8N6H2_9CNID|nr:unnamed protein product [Porites evermanni]